MELEKNGGSFEAGNPAPIIRREAADILEQIITILNDDSLDDFYCIEEIVELLSENGIYTPRHDFG